MIPRALRSPVFGMARPARPAVEAWAVREAAALIRAETGATKAAPIARLIAARVVEEMRAYLTEDSDPVLAALGEARRRMKCCSISVLATEPEADAVSLFVEERVKRLRSRHGRTLTVEEDAAEHKAIWAVVMARLTARYLRVLRHPKDMRNLCT